MTQSLGVGAQFGGKYFCHDVRVIRLPRHGASLPIGLGVSCSADRQALGKITRDGVYLEELEHNPAKYLPDIDHEKLGGEVVQIDLNRPMQEILATSEQISDQDAALAHRPDGGGARSGACQTARAAGAGQGLPDYFKNHPVYYAGPGQDAGRLCLGRVRPDHRRPHGLLHRRFPGCRRLAGLASPRATARRRCARPARSMAASISPPSAGQRRTSPSIHQEGRACWNIPSSAWRRSGGSRWRISPPSS